MDPNYDPPPTSLNPAARTNYAEAMADWRSAMAQWRETGGLTDRIAEMGVIRPGDTLLIRFDRPVSMADATDYRQRLEAMVPGVQFVLIDAAQALIVRRNKDVSATT